MLRSLLKSVWRRMTGKAVVETPPAAINDALALRSELRAALVSILREPLAYPNTIDYAMVAHLMAAKSSADYMTNHIDERPELGAPGHPVGFCARRVRDRRAGAGVWRIPRQVIARHRETGRLICSRSMPRVWNWISREWRQKSSASSAPKS